MAQTKDVRPRVTLTKSMPMSQWDRLLSQQQPAEEKTFDEEKRNIAQKVLLRHYQEMLDKKINGDIPSVPSQNLNDNLQHEACHSIAVSQSRIN